MAKRSAAMPRAGDRVTAVPKSPILMEDRSGSPMDHKRRINIFVSYSHKDEADKDRLVTHLKIMERAGLIA